MSCVRFLWVFLHLIIFDIELRLIGFEKVFPKYVKRHTLKKLEDLTPEKIPQIEKWGQMIDKACASYPLEAQCLHRSFLGYRFFRRKFHIPVELVVGVRKFPFGAHAWLVLQGQNFNEDPEYTSNFVVILNSAEGGARG